MPSAVAVAAAVGILGLLAGCELPTEESFLPTAAIEITPPQDYLSWWNQTRQCSGLDGTFSQLHWYVVPGVSTIANDHDEVAGFWLAGRRAIVLAGWYQLSPLVVRHEMLHALLRVPGHPAEYFRVRCAGVVG